MSERFNTMGVAERDCVICFRQNSLVGARDGNHPILTCSRCGNRFRLTWADGVTIPHNELERLDGVAPARGYVAVQDRK